MWKWIVPVCVAYASTLCAETTVLAFAGSTREDSVNKKLVVDAANVARRLGAKVTLINLGDYQMPFYDADVEAKEKMPAKAKELRELMMKSKVIMIASPEYNGSLSGILKNAIDWATRSEDGGPSRDAFKGKTFLIMSASPGQSGGSRGLVHLRSIIENVGGKIADKQITIPGAYSAFNEQGLLKDQNSQKELEQAVTQALKSA